MLCFHKRIVVLFNRGFDRIWKGFQFNLEGKKEKTSSEELSWHNWTFVFVFAVRHILKINLIVIFIFFILVLLQKHGERNKKRAFSQSLYHLTSIVILHAFCLYVLCVCAWCMFKSGKQILSWIAKVWYFMACSHRMLSL